MIVKLPPLPFLLLLHLLQALHDLLAAPLLLNNQSTVLVISVLFQLDLHVSFQLRFKFSLLAGSIFTVTAFTLQTTHQVRRLMLLLPL